MEKTTFKINKMDCPSEEQMICMKLEDFPVINSLEFDIPKRLLHIHHQDDLNNIEKAIAELDMDSSILQSEKMFILRL